MFETAKTTPSTTIHNFSQPSLFSDERNSTFSQSLRNVSNTNSKLVRSPDLIKVDLDPSTNTVITHQPQSLNVNTEDNLDRVRQHESGYLNFLKNIAPGLHKLINGCITDCKSELTLQLEKYIDGNALKGIHGEIKNELKLLKEEITEAKNANDKERIDRLFAKALNSLEKLGVSFDTTQKAMLYLAFQGIKVRQPLLMGQTYYTAPVFGPAGSAKFGLHFNVVPPSILDNLLGSKANTETHLQVFLHNELGGSVSFADIGNNMGCFGYAGLISHDGLDFTLSKDGKWSLGKPQLIVERVIRGEGNIGWNKEGMNVQHTLGSDYLSQRFFSCDSAGIAAAAAHVLPKWGAGAASLVGMTSAAGWGCAPLAAATFAFHATDQITKQISEYVGFMKPAKEFRLVELATLSAPVDGGYTHSSGFGFRVMARMNGGFGTLKNNNPPPADNKLSLELTSTSQNVKSRELNSTSQETELRQRSALKQNEPEYYRV